MAGECNVSEIVTSFIRYTCRLRPRPTKRDVQAATSCACVTAGHPYNDEEAEYIPLITGSIAEFYIEPFLPHVGDIDVMFYINTQLAIPRGHLPPTQLPAEFHNYVYVHEITDSHLPGYVYLPLSYLLTRCVDDGKYEYVKYEQNFLLGRYSKDMGRNTFIHGPAVFHDNSDRPPILSIDAVYCIRCLSWPPQAADWPTRHRNYGWPDSATLDRIVSDGCDLVNVAHRQCRQDELMGKHQWRLSFSRAEITLINSWMPVQQIVYHMLRYFIKTERLTDCADNSEAGTMSNYHVKTLMLWACELHPRSWWTVDLNLARICVELLNTLSAWLTDTRCPHYFVNNWKLVDNSLDVESVACKLISIHEEYLSTWLMKNYIRQCAQFCPDHILRLFYDVRTTLKLQKAVSEIICWRLNTIVDDTWWAVEYAEYSIVPYISVQSLTTRAFVCWMNELTKVDERFSAYFSAVALLHVARRILRNGFSGELMDILSLILGPDLSQFCSFLSLTKTELNTSELVNVIQKTAVEHLTTYRQREARDFGSAPLLVTIVTTDFEALYAYKRGDYQRCLQLSIQNVHLLLYADRMPLVLTCLEFSQLLDDDIVSLTALLMVVDPKSRYEGFGSSITQLTLSLYLMTQCQLKLHHPTVTSLTQILDCIKVAQRRHSLRPKHTLEQLTLKLIERKLEIGLQRL